VNHFKKSSRCSGGNCVEVEIDEECVTLKDSDGDYVCYTLEEWRAFIAGVKLGEFDV
jgi:hypothetical protein